MQTMGSQSHHKGVCEQSHSATSSNLLQSNNYTGVYIFPIAPRGYQALANQSLGLFKWGLVSFSIMDILALHLYSSWMQYANQACES